MTEAWSRARPDLSTKLVHLIKGEALDDAFDTILAILKDRKLRGGSGMIKGGFTCVCFTEAPVAQLALSLADRQTSRFKYRPIGIMVDKAWAFERGTRPAIYQPDDEYDLLPDIIKYRHVRYDPYNKVDFTWEREWRLHAFELPFTPEDVTLIFPDRIWTDAFNQNHFEEVKAQVEAKGVTALQRYPWHVIALSDLGIDVPWDFEKPSRRHSG